jgi:hypothetical protein
MKRYGLIAAISLLIAVNALVLANVAHNRSGEHDAEVKLTEREMPILSYWRGPDKENTGLSLRLDWDTSNHRMTTKVDRYLPKHAAWFDQAKLQAIGFDCSLPLNSENAELYYDKMLPRKTFAVLEYEGRAWQAWREEFKQRIAEQAEQVRKGEETKKDLDELKKDYEDSVKTKSRLFIVDVGNDAALLRQKYKDRGRYIITPAKVRLWFKKDQEVKPEIAYLEGEISELLVNEINVPLSKRALLDQLIKDNKNQQYNYYGYGYSNRQRPPYYTVTVRYGKRYEPWIVDIQKIAE